MLPFFSSALLLPLLYYTYVGMINFLPLFTWQNEKYTNKPHANTVEIFFSSFFSFSGFCCSCIRGRLTMSVPFQQFNSYWFRVLFCLSLFLPFIQHSIIWMKWDVANLERTIHRMEYIYQDCSRFHNVSEETHFIFVIHFLGRKPTLPSANRPNLSKLKSNPYPDVFVYV